LDQNIETPEIKKTQRTALNLKYHAESQVIRSKLGDIEEVRKELGISQRKMAQLLMVDPSSWNRWAKTGNTPPYIYRSLQWYLSLIEKQPEWHPQNSFLGGNDTRIYELERKFTKQVNQLTDRNLELENQLKKQSSLRRKELMLFCSLLFIFAVGALLLK